eukprot:scaffold130269_cov14-Tisochrysis_lutea.AAC.1
MKSRYTRFKLFIHCSLHPLKHLIFWVPHMSDASCFRIGEITRAPAACCARNSNVQLYAQWLLCWVTCLERPCNAWALACLVMPPSCLV